MGLMIYKPIYIYHVLLTIGTFTTAPRCGFCVRRRLNNVNHCT